MNLVITDSGLGGLSVCALLISILKESSSSRNLDKIPEVLRISYINAVPSNEHGYNSMSSKLEQVEIFEKILRNIKQLVNPNYIFVACGTLSVVLKETYFKKENPRLIDGILSIGINLMLKSLFQNSDSKVIIFGTPTTINSNNLKNTLLQNGIEPSRVINQSCPKLADQISNDSDGIFVEDRIQNWVQKAICKLEAKNHQESLFVFLGCTHYGYYEKLFYKSFLNEGFKNVKIINPNLSAAKSLSKMIMQDEILKKNRSIDFSIEFVSPYKIPEKEILTITRLLNPISSETATALKNAQTYPKLLD